jgi:hypothetical protein
MSEKPKQITDSRTLKQMSPQAIQQALVEGRLNDLSRNPGRRMIPWSADPLRIPEPAPVVELLDGERLELTIVPITGFAYDWPVDNPQPNEED